MEYLLDTHVFLWWNLDPARLSKKALDAISDPSSTVFLSAASVWEIAIKRQAGRLVFSHSAKESAEQAGFNVLPMTADDAERAAVLPAVHSDPFDRMLVAQARSNGLVLITADSKLFNYPVTVLPAR